MAMPNGAELQKMMRLGCSLWQGRSNAVLKMPRPWSIFKAPAHVDAASSTREASLTVAEAKATWRQPHNPPPIAETLKTPQFRKSMQGTETHTQIRGCNLEGSARAPRQRVQSKRPRPKERALPTARGGDAQRRGQNLVAHMREHLNPEEGKSLMRPCGRIVPEEHHSTGARTSIHAHSHQTSSRKMNMGPLTRPFWCDDTLNELPSAAPARAIGLPCIREAPNTAQGPGDRSTAVFTRIACCLNPATMVRSAQSRTEV